MRNSMILAAGLLIGFGLAQLVPVVGAKAQSTTTGPYQMYVTGNGAYGFLLDTATGDLWFCHPHLQAGAPAAIQCDPARPTGP